MSSAPPQPAQPLAPTARSAWLVIRALAGDIKVAHSVFAMPFAVLASFLVGPSSGATAAAWRSFAGKLALVVACMVCARTWAMLFNRLVDRSFDAANPRTAKRSLASGRVSPAAGWVAAAAAAGLFVGLCVLFKVFFSNPWPLYLCTPVLAWIAFYSLTKRFTWACHAFLGGALGASPVAAAIAVDPASVFSTPTLWWLAGFVLAWVAGFDVVYALQDEPFDREQGLRSIPAMLGARGALWASRAAHAVAALLLLAAWTSSARLGPAFGVGIGAVVVLLLVEHALTARIVRRNDPSGWRMTMAFFTINGVVSCLLGALGVYDALTR